MKQSGYPWVPLARKLGIKEGFKIRLIKQPVYYFDLFTDMPGNVKVLKDKKRSKDLVHYFTKEIRDLQEDIISLKKEIYPNGALWISWPKKASKIKTNITEDIIRRIALSNGLVDIKACAVDETWSALKLVIPLKDRKAGR